MLHRTPLTSNVTFAVSSIGHFPSKEQSLVPAMAHLTKSEASNPESTYPLLAFP